MPLATDATPLLLPQHIHNPHLRLTHRSKVLTLRRDRRIPEPQSLKTTFLPIPPALANPLVGSKGHILDTPALMYLAVKCPEVLNHKVQCTAPQSSRTPRKQLVCVTPYPLTIKGTEYPIALPQIKHVLATRARCSTHSGCAQRTQGPSSVPGTQTHRASLRTNP